MVLAPSALKFCRKLADDQSGTSVMEFGLLTTVFIGFLIGCMDVGQMAYTQAILNGAVQEAGRASSLESGNTTAVDARVQLLVSRSAPGVTVETSRLSYFDFNDIKRAESWGDSDGNGTCDNDENYVDENANGTWDEDVGRSGNGSANDVVMYEVTANFSPLFPNPFFNTENGMRSVSSSTIKKNQPFARQRDSGSDSGVCT